MIAATRRLAAFLCACVVLATGSASARADGIGFLPGPAGFDGSITNADGSPDLRAGSHPYEVTTTFSLNTTADSNGKLRAEGGDFKDLEVEVPPGLIGNVNAVPVCSELEFFTPGVTTGGPSCNNNSVVGVLHVGLRGGFKGGYVPVFNLQPSAGVVAEWGAMVASTPIILRSSVRSDSDYGVTVSLPSNSQALAVTGSTLTLWGVPADPSHDPLRGLRCLNGDTGASNGNCPSGAVPTPYLTLPTSCAGPQAFRIAVDSWANPGLFATDSFLTHDNSGNPIGFEGCDQLSLTPTVSAKPTTDLAEAPSGLDFKIEIADEGLTNPGGRAQSQIKKTIVTLPQGVTVNPSAGEGLGACTPSDYHRETARSAPGGGCPNSSKIGEVTIESPLLQQPVSGALFIAQPDDPATPTPGAENPFDALLAIYIVAKLPERGLLIKVAGKIEANPETGQLTTTFDNIPQLPFARFSLHFREGQSAPLVSPPTCGTFTTQAAFVPWAAADPNNPAPEEVVHGGSSFTITKGVGGGPCPSGRVPPFNPQVVTGTQDNAAGSYSPFYLRLARNDGEQELTRFSTIMPPGLTGNLTGIPFCPDAAVEAARRRTGTQELGEPSCPAASKIGHTLVGAGVGSVLAQTPGSLYLAGPYHGAPFSLVSVTSATVGPFDLGTVVIRFALRINPVTTQVEVDATGSDPIPHIIQGIVVHVRDIRAYIDRPSFIKNPTSCEHMQIANTINGAGADPANPADQVPFNVISPFQAANCASLAFTPRFTATVTGKTSKMSGAGLKVNIAYPNSPQGIEANIRAVKVELPVQLPSRLTTLQKACTRAQFDNNPAGCPVGSVVGHARAITPILPVPLEGPVYFVSNGGEAFPNLIMVLQGYGVTIDLVGDTFISKAGVTSSTFKTVPDQPVTSFELTLPQGPYSALAANVDLCTLTHTTLIHKATTRKPHGHTRRVRVTVRHTSAATLQMPTDITGQNGMIIHQATPIAITECAKANAKTAKKARRALAHGTGAPPKKTNRHRLVA